MKARAIVRGAVLLTALAGTRSALYAQNQDTTHVVHGRIVFIAGADLHVELQTRLVLQPGDTLLVRRGDVARGALIVVAADTVRAVVNYAGAPFALTRGELLAAELRRASVARVEAAPVALPQAPPTPPVVEPGVRADAEVGRNGAVRPEASGYIASTTSWIRQSGASGNESYSIPAATLSLRVTHLPGRSSLQVFARAEHYGSGLPPATPGGATHVRVYSARLESQTGPVRVGVGRLTSHDDPFGGSWDGLMLETGRQVSVAGGFGWEPEQGTGAVTSRYPRISLGTQARAGAGTARYRGTLSALHYLDEAPAGRGSLAVSTRHSLNTGPVSVWGDVVAEKSDSTDWSMRWGGLQVALRNHRGARVHLGYRRYHPFQLAIVDSLVSFSATSRVEAGGSMPFGRTALSLTAATTPGAPNRMLSATSRLYVRALPGNLDLDASAGLWQRGDARTVNAGAGLARSTGRIFARVAYRIERGPERDPVLGRELDGELTVLVARRSSISALAFHSAAGATNGTQLQLRLTWGF